MSTPEPDPAIARFWMLQLMRLGGLMLVIAGVLILGKVVDGPDVLGYGLLLLGAVEFFLMPQLLAKKWKSPGE